MDRHFFFLAYLTANKQQRRWLVIIWAVVPLLLALAMFLTLSPYRGISYQYQESYPIVGTENRQLWTLKGSELVTLFNENLPDTAPELSYLHEPTPSDRQIMLTDNGKTWSIVFRQVPEDAASIYFWSKQPEIDAWLGNVEDVKLSLYHTSAQDILLNEQYARCLINIFTPGAEDYVTRRLHLSRPLTSGYKRVKTGDVLYIHKGGTSPVLIIEPDCRNWPPDR